MNELHRRSLSLSQKIVIEIFELHLAKRRRWPLRSCMFASLLVAYSLMPVDFPSALWLIYIRVIFKKVQSELFCELVRAGVPVCDILFVYCTVIRFPLNLHVLVAS